MEPDYSKYSNLELRQAIESIDKKKYPERYKNLASEIASRKGNVEDEELKTKQNNKELWLTLVCVLFVIPLFILMGVDAISSGEFSLKHRVITKEENLVFFVAYVAFCFGMVPLLIFGLLKRQRNGTSQPN